MPTKSDAKAIKLLYSADEEPVFSFETTFRKHFEAATVLNFKVTLRGYSSYNDNDAGGAIVAQLNGFLFQPGYMPEGYDDGFFDVFDMRSGHAAEAYHLLAEKKSLVEEALEQDDVTFDELESVAYFERAWVHPGLRGEKIALRLLREAKHVLGRPGLIVMLKAFPDEKATAAACKKLAKYYSSDERLRLHSVSKDLPGWLVGFWDSGEAYEGDERYVEIDLTKLTQAADPHRD
jgi:hypothetical protein